MTGPTRDQVRVPANPPVPVTVISSENPSVPMMVVMVGDEGRRNVSVAAPRGLVTGGMMLGPLNVTSYV